MNFIGRVLEKLRKLMLEWLHLWEQRPYRLAVFLGDLRGVPFLKHKECTGEGGTVISERLAGHVLCGPELTSGTCCRRGPGIAVEGEMHQMKWPE